jgi:thiol:disulfide interchange protein
VPSLIPLLVIQAALLAPVSKVKVTTSVAPEKAGAGAKVELRFDCAILRGWHIYAPNFTGTGKPTRVTVDPGPLVPSGALLFPEPLKKHEEVLDEDLLYHEGNVRFRQPLLVAAGAPPGKSKVSGKLEFMACSDAICDPPASIPWEAEVEVLPAGGPGAAPAPGAAPPVLQPLPGLEGLGDRAKPAAGAPVTFKLAVEPDRVALGGRGELVARYRIAPGYHIYPTDHRGETGKPTTFVIASQFARAVGKPVMDPPPREKEAFGQKERILEGEGVIRQPIVLEGQPPLGKTTIPVTVDYMVCDARLCEPGQAKAEAALEVLPAGAAAAGDPVGAAQAVGWGALILLAAGGAFLALIMPCTYPMIPITISFFTKQAEARKTGVLPLALAYGAGIVLDFILIGLVVGPPIKAFAFHPVTNGIFAAVFIGFGLSLLGLYEIRLPSSFNAMASRAGGVQGYLGVFLLGATLVITSFTCTAPIVGALLASGAQAKSFAEIVVGMGAFGLTMALPFVALSLFPGRARSLPRSGEWMHTLKVTLGFIELAAALKFISNVDVALRWNSFPRETFLYTVGAISVTTALYLFGVIRLRGESEGVGPMRVVLGMMSLVFSLYCFHGAQGNQLNFIMEAFAPPYSAREVAAGPGGGSQVQAKGKAEEPAAWTKVEDDFEGGLTKALEEKKLALINWTGAL